MQTLIEIVSSQNYNLSPTDRDALVALNREYRRKDLVIQKQVKTNIKL